MADGAKKKTAKASSSSVRRISTVEGDKAIADALFLSIGEGAIVTDSTGKVSRINQAALEMLGFELEDIFGKWYPDTVVAEEESGKRIPNIERPIAQVFLNGKTIFRKLYYRRPDGTRIAVALTVSPVFLEGKPIGAIEIFRDITEELKLDRAKDEFISLASHQLRTPATGVKQYLSMLLDGFAGSLSKSQTEFVETAHKSNDRQLRIIDDILRVAAADSGTLVLNKQKTDLVPLIKAVLDEQHSKFANNAQAVTFSYDTPEVYVNVDSDLIRMVLENLIDNAHKYTYPGKNIEIGLSASTKTNKVNVLVRDEGTGIDSADFDKLFQKFSRLDNPLSVSSGGTGLGLYWVKQIVGLHGGKITVESKLGQGTKFKISLDADSDSGFSNSQTTD